MTDQTPSRIGYGSVTELRWSSAARETIDCRVDFDHLSEPVPFHAAPWDVEAHGREIFVRALAGDFGPIGDPLPPRA